MSPQDLLKPTHHLWFLYHCHPPSIFTFLTSFHINSYPQHCTWQLSTLCLHHRCDGRKLCLQRRLLKSKGQHAEWNYLHPKCRDDSQVSAVEVSVPTDAIETERWGSIPRCCVLDSDELLNLDVDKLVRPIIIFTPFVSSRKKPLSSWIKQILRFKFLGILRSQLIKSHITLSFITSFLNLESLFLLGNICCYLKKSVILFYKEIVNSI